MLCQKGGKAFRDAKEYGLWYHDPLIARDGWVNVDYQGIASYASGFVNAYQFAEAITRYGKFLGIGSSYTLKPINANVSCTTTPKEIKCSAPGCQKLNDDDPKIVNCYNCGNPLRRVR
ncbi:MAG: hypothetical protein KGH64_00625 [Candidatus Micrarchaeota archaeon]|nr:hypothetical protein [Candidatus Micrarchaeota archaeon]